MDFVSESLRVFLDDPTFANLLWAAPSILACGILAGFEFAVSAVLLSLVCAISLIGIQVGVFLFVAVIRIVWRLLRIA